MSKKTIKAGIDDIRDEAIKLHRALKARGIQVKLSDIHESMAAAGGLRNWNTFVAIRNATAALPSAQQPGKRGMDCPTFVAFIEGGCLKDFVGNGPGRLLVIDSDVDGCDRYNVWNVNGEESYVTLVASNPESDSESVESIMLQVGEHPDQSEIKICLETEDGHKTRWSVYVRRDAAGKLSIAEPVVDMDDDVDSPTARVTFSKPSDTNDGEPGPYASIDGESWRSLEMYGLVDAFTDLFDRNPEAASRLFERAFFDDEAALRGAIEKAIASSEK